MQIKWTTSEKESISKYVQWKKSIIANPYVILLILEGIDREEMNYNTYFSKYEIINMEFMEGEDRERIKRVKENVRNGDSQAKIT